MLTEQAKNSAELQALNQQRLNSLLSRPHPVFAYDIHGFVLGRDESTNKEPIDQIARFLAGGGVAAAVTGFGDRIEMYHVLPVIERLKTMRVDPEQTQFWLSTRNGAQTRHAVTREIIDEKPLCEDEFEAIAEHPLVQAMQAITPQDKKDRLRFENEEKVRHGMAPHPRAHEVPGMRADWCSFNSRCYHVTAQYGPWAAEIAAYNRNSFIDTIMGYCEGVVPASSHEMAPFLLTALQNAGLRVSTHTAAGHTEIDISSEGVSKERGCQVLLPHMAQALGCDEETVRAIGIGGGDSPLYNDKPLIEFFKYGVTNNPDFWQYYTEKGPIILDFPDVTNQVEQTAQFLSRLKAQ